MTGAAGSQVAHSRPAFASLPDRGELLAYQAQQVRHDGAYTWHRANISEAHALHAMADGHLRMTTPSGALLNIQYDRHVEHPSGDWTWVGHLPGHPEKQTILTFGEHAAFGSIAQSDGLPLRLTVRNGASWLVETDPRKIAMISNAATRPTRPDFKIPAKNGVGGVASSGDRAMATTSAPATAAAGTTPTTTVDVIIGYTAAFASDNGGASGALTRLNFMVDVTNTAYTNSAIPAQVRLLHAMQVTYSDATDNGAALEALTGSTGSSDTTPDPAFNALRAAREQYGADLVSLVRKFDEPTNGGCGIAWLIGGGQSGIATSDESFGYSVVSDGEDMGSDGKNYFCQDETLAHELGHNMGAAHDVDTAKGDDGTLDAEDYGAFSYSFGYKTTPGNGNFYTVMAYGDTGQLIYRIFSDPRSTFCGSRACGDATTADNARTLTQTIPTVATFRGTAVAEPGSAPSDFNGDGVSDVFWRNFADGRNIIWRSANASTTQSASPVTVMSWRVVGIGDFDGDGKADVLWRNASTGGNIAWRSGNSATTLDITDVTDVHWQVAGVGDVDGDSKADIVWRNDTTGENVIWKSGDAHTRQTMPTVPSANWRIVGMGDFDADGKSDLLWRYMPSGSHVIWRSGNSASTIAVTSVPDLRWQIAAVGDVNGDGHADIVWRNTSTGADLVWKSANSSQVQAMTAVSDLHWQIVNIGDYDGDGAADLLWRNTSTGGDAIWRSADSHTTLPIVAVTDLNWQIVR